MYAAAGLVTSRTAGRCLRQARELGLTIPKAVTDAEAFAAEVEQVATAPAPVRPSPPALPGELASLVADHVDAVRAHAQSRHVAATYRSDAEGALIDAVRAAAEGWITAMVTMYADHLAAFEKASPRLPQDATAERLDRLTPTQFKHWQTADRAAFKLDAIVHARRDFDRMLNQPAGRFGDLAAAATVTAIPEGVRCREVWQWVSYGAKQWRSATLDRVTRWRALSEAAVRADLTLSLAERGRLHHRAMGYQTWLDTMLTPNLRNVLT